MVSGSYISHKVFKFRSLLSGQKSTWIFFLSALISLQGCTSGFETDTVSLPKNTPEVLNHPDDPAMQEHLQMLKAFGGEYRNDRITAMLDHVLRKIVPASSQPYKSYRITLLNSQVINAFALPSGRLYITRGLLALANDTSEIAAVMAHEIAHVSLHHAAARTELELRSALVSRVIADVLQDKTGSSRYSQKSKFSIARFSRAQEIQADKISVETIAKAGFDPFGAVRFLHSLERSSGTQKTTQTDMLSTHPSTKDRIHQALISARRYGAPDSGLGYQDRDAYQDAINGLVYGDTAQDGIVKGRRFIHSALKITFEAPSGFTLENTSKAVLGVNQSSGLRLLFDVVHTNENLEAVLNTVWSDTIEPENFQPVDINGISAVKAEASSPEWFFRLAALRQGGYVFRLIIASSNNDSTLEQTFKNILNSVHTPSYEELSTIQPQQIKIVKAEAKDSVRSLISRCSHNMSTDLFYSLNGLDPGAKLSPNQRYKVVVD